MSNVETNISNQIKSQKIHRWRIWLILFILIVALGAGIYYYFKIKNSRTESNTTPTGENQSEAKPVIETWTKNPIQLFANTTSSDSHELSNGNYRMFSLGQGGIKYADSSDGKIFSQSIATGVTEDTGKFMSNPAVLKISENNWIMIYEQAPMKKPGESQSNNPPGPTNQRNLYLATSSDGKTFAKAGLAVDSSTEDNYFASVPDLVLLSGGNIRMYYVSYGDRIASRTSSDNGKTWIKDEGIRKSDMAVDPDVLTKTDNGKTKWVMYYTNLDPSKNALFKAASTDGLTWDEGTKVLDRGNKDGVIVDPDVIPLSNGAYQMFFGESATATGSINLYYATSSGDIFN